MEKLELSAQIRTEVGKGNIAVRHAGMMPAVIYGGKQSYNIKVSKNVFDKMFTKAGESTIIEISLDGKVIPVLIKEYQRDPVTEDLLHVDFYEVDMNKEIEANVPLIFVGTAPALKLGGTLVNNLSEVVIKCLPKDLIHDITVDVSGLATFEDKILVSDLVVPATIKIVTSPSHMVVKVEEHKEEVFATTTEADAIAAVETVKPVKKEEEAVEGEEKKK